MQPIALFDIPSKTPGIAWSPNTWKIRFRLCHCVLVLYSLFPSRYALNFKGLPYKTVWVEYPDIADLCKSIGAEPTDIREEDGSPYYSLPVIQDPNTATVLSESALIAEYLDSTYPDTPRLIPSGTHALQTGFRVAYRKATDASFEFVIPAMAGKLYPRSQEYYVRTREIRFGKKLSEVTPVGEARDVAWTKLKAGFGKVNSWMRDHEPFVMGDVVSFSDFLLGGELQVGKFQRVLSPSD